MSEMELCPHCGERTNIPNRVSMWGMYDNHTFTRYEAKTVDELINAWAQSLKDDDPGISLCPVVVFIGKREVRRVGKMIHPRCDVEAVKEFRETILADPDISRILANT